MSYENYQPIVEVTRGSVVESVHWGALVAVTPDGKVIASWGDPSTFTFLRSSSKPFQALPLIEMGGAEAFSMTQDEIAVICASHSGTNEHVRVIEGLQRKIGITEQNLMCGTHMPYDSETANYLIKNNLAPTPNRHNCSGKHTGMLAHATLRELPLENYLDFDHPLQQTILKTFSEMCDMDVDKIELGIDGCSAPVFAVPIFNAALAFARFANPTGLASGRAEALRKIFFSMGHSPFMVAGPKRFDTDVMTVTNGAVVSKAGAEGYQGIAIAPGVLGPDHPGCGIAFKISDGDTTNRARSLVAVEILRQLGAITDQQIEALASHAARPVYNWRRLVVGEMRPCFQAVH